MFAYVNQAQVQSLMGIKLLRD